eukprot:g381.t1
MTKGLSTSMKGLTLTQNRSSFLTGQSLISSPPPSLLRSLSSTQNTIEAAHKKGAGSTKNGRDSISKRRGVKVFGMQKVKAGGIIIRQLGTKFHPGHNVGLGRDYTIFAKQEGIVFFERGKGTRKMISVYPDDHPKIVAKRPPPVQKVNANRAEQDSTSDTPQNIENEQSNMQSDQDGPVF